MSPVSEGIAIHTTQEQLLVEDLHLRKHSRVAGERKADSLKRAQPAVGSVGASVIFAFFVEVWGFSQNICPRLVCQKHLSSSKVRNIMDPGTAVSVLTHLLFVAPVFWGFVDSLGRLWPDHPCQNGVRHRGGCGGRLGDRFSPPIGLWGC